MTCQVCKSTRHSFNDCNSLYAIAVECAIRHWLHHRLIQLYTTNAYQEDILWIARSHHFTRVSRGELLYLNRKHMIDDPAYVREILIYTYLSHFMIDFVDSINQSDYSERAYRQMSIDADYWYALSNHVSHEYAMEIRKEQMSPNIQFIYETITDTNEKRGCPICLEEELDRNATYELSCRHSVCIKCTEQLLQKRIPLCPMCRTPIQTLVGYEWSK
jgi:hypothetical protein